MKTVSVTEVPTTAQLIDVREPEEYATGHARGAVNIPMGEISNHLDQLDTDNQVYVICQAGKRSATVCEYLEEQDIRCVNVDGGTSAWQQANLPTD